MTAFEYVQSNWKTSIVGIGKFINGAILVYNAYNESLTLAGGVSMVPAWVVVQFGAINAALQLAGGLVSKDSDKGSNVPTKYVDPQTDTPQPQYAAMWGTVPRRDDKDKNPSNPEK